MDTSYQCLACSGEDSRSILTKGELVLVRCRDCGFVQIDPLPPVSEYEASYEEAEDYGEALLRDEELFVQRDRAVLEELANLGGQGPLLDLGAGAGIILAAAKDRGWSSTGLELCRPNAEKIRQRLGVAVHEQSIERAPLDDESFSVVTMSHSLEHVHNPLHTLEAAHRVLKADGLLHIAVPNWRAVKRFVLGRHIPWIFPGHISYFTRGTLEQLLRRTGFEVVRAQTLPFTCTLDHRFAISVVRRLRLEPPIQRFLKIGQRPLETLLGDHVQLDCPPWRFRMVDRLCRVLLRLWPDRASCWFGMGEELRVTARKVRPIPTMRQPLPEHRAQPQKVRQSS